METQEIVYLNVPFQRKNLARKLGCWFDGEKKLWCTRNTNKNLAYLLETYGSFDNSAPPPKQKKNKDKAPENGILYCMTNPCLPGLTKNGYTTRKIEERVKELSGTSVPQPFVCEYFLEVGNVKDAERRLHIMLVERGFERPNPKREFFKGEPKNMYAVYEEIQRQFPPCVMLKVPDETDINPPVLDKLNDEPPESGGSTEIGEPNPEENSWWSSTKKVAGFIFENAKSLGSYFS